MTGKLKISRVRAVLFFFLFCLATAAFGLDNPEQKVSEMIKDYVITKYPNWLKEEIRVTFKTAERSFDTLAKLGESAGFRILEVYPEFKPVGNVVFPIEFSDGERKDKLFIRTKVEVVKKIAAAAKLCKRGKILEESDLKFEDRDVALLPQKYFIGYNSLISREAQITIPANSTIFEWMVGNTPLIRRGSEVTILVIAPGVTVKAKGEAMEDGDRDAEIKVKRRDSEKIISARVVSPNEVEVKL